MHLQSLYYITVITCSRDFNTSEIGHLFFYVTVTYFKTHLFLLDKDQDKRYVYVLEEWWDDSESTAQLHIK